MMMNEWLEEIKRISIFIIIAQVFVRLGVGSTYEKYLKFTVNFLVFSQVVSMMFGIFKVDFNDLFYDKLNTYYEESNIFSIELEKELEDISIILDKGEGNESIEN
ncbi:MAG: hypothetical protein ACRC7V_03680 [Lachnospiraceae bacterium]